MRKALTGIMGAALIAGTLAASATSADAQYRRGWGVGPAVGLGILGGVIVGSAIANSYGRQYVVEPGWEPYAAYRVRGPVGCPGGYWDFRLLEHSRTNPERSSGQPAHHDDGRNEHRAPYPHRPTLSSGAMSSSAMAPFRIGAVNGRKYVDLTC